MWDHMYEWFSEIESPTTNWNKEVDESNRRVFWRKDEGLASMTFLTDVIMDTCMTNLLCCFEDETVL